MKHARKDYDRIQDPAEKIGEDEPVFLIRAKDKSAPQTVKLWADLNEFHGGDSELSESARTHANAMKEWQKENGCKPATA